MANCSSGNGGSPSPCGACKFLRRKCGVECIFAPYFCSEQGPARFAAIHKVFGASNVSKLLLHIPAQDRSEAVLTIAYEAQARIRDPVYGCVSHIFALQQQVACLQAQLMQLKAQLAHKSFDNPYYNHNNYNINPPISPQSSLDSIHHHTHTHSPNGSSLMSMQQDSFCNFQQPPSSSSSSSYDHSNDLGELQDLALRMMRN